MAYYDLYCERLAPGLLAEPVNAVTNAAFFLAAWLAWREARRLRPAARDIIGLIALCVVIGIGSTLFHTFASGWARVFDELPILLFQLLFLWSYARRVAGLGAGSAAAGIAAFLACALYARQFSHLMNGSLVYAPAVATMLGVATYHWWRGFPARALPAAATGMLMIAVGLRTLDSAVCSRFPLGTHFLWHLLVAAVAYLCLRTLLEYARAQPAAGARN